MLFHIQLKTNPVFWPYFGNLDFSLLKGTQVQNPYTVIRNTTFTALIINK